MSAWFLPVLPRSGYLHHLDPRVVHRDAVLLESAPVGVADLDDELALLHQPLEDRGDVEQLVGLAACLASAGGAVALEAQRQVLEVDEYGERVRLVSHGRSSPYVSVSGDCASVRVPL